MSGRYTKVRRSARSKSETRNWSSCGCPYDNAAMENVFGMLKTECLYRRKFSCRAEVKQAVAYVPFYHYRRIDLKNGLTPFEIRSKTV